MKDYYLATNAWYWVIQVVWLVYMFGIPCYIVLILNTYIPDTLFRVDLLPGTYFSMRYTSFWWVLMFISGFKLFNAILYPLATLFRLNRGCSIMWLVFMFLFFFCSMFVFIGMSSVYSKCNQNGQVDNPCNSLSWCCVPEIYSNDQNLCPQGNYPCNCPDDIISIVNCPVYPTTVAGLGANVDFMWTYFVHMFYFIIDMCLVSFYTFMLVETHVFTGKSKKINKKDE